MAPKPSVAPQSREQVIKMQALGGKIPLRLQHVSLDRLTHAHGMGGGLIHPHGTVGSHMHMAWGAHPCLWCGGESSTAAFPGSQASKVLVFEHRWCDMEH